MSNELLQQLMEAKKNSETAYVSFFNDGSIKRDPHSYERRLKDEANAKRTILDIVNVLAKSVEKYSRNGQFDTVCMNLLLGLMYNSEDIDENNNIKENAKPIKNVVRYYTDKTGSYENGKRTNDFDYGKEIYGIQGFVDYNMLVSALKAGGLEYYGPANFEEFKNLILSGKTFDIMVQGNLTQNNDKTYSKRR